MNFFWVYDIPNWQFAILTVLFFVLFAICGLLFLQRNILQRFIPQSHNDIVSFFMSGMGAIYGITLGLIAVGAWENFNGVEDIVQNESASLATLYLNIGELKSSKKDSLKTALREYTNYTIVEGWPQQQHGQLPKGGTKRLQNIQNLMLAVEPVSKTDEIVLKQCFGQFDQMLFERRKRLEATNEGLPSAIWYVIVFGALINIVITWFFKTDSFRVHILMISMYASLLGSLVFLIAAMDNPFRGEFSVGPDAFQTVYENMLKN
jgi:tetrahydromethanopterin S-methyltransferase subunit E